MVRFFAVIVVLSLAVGCSDDSGNQRPNSDQPDTGTADASADIGTSDDARADSLDIDEGCNPVGAPVDCLLPFPSDVFRTDGQLTVPASALPTATPMSGDQPLDFQALHPADGASPYPPIVALLDGPVEETSLTFHTDDLSQTLGPGSTTVLIDSDTGEFVPHFAELDPRTDGALRPIIIRPLAALEYGRRYVVAIQNVTASGGDVIEPNEAFRRLRDDQPGPPALEGVRARYETEVFDVLDSAGLERASLQLAWDFTVRTEQDAIGDMLRVRELTLAALDATPPPVTVVEVEDDVNEWIARRVELTISVPLFMENGEPGAFLHRGADGQIEQNGTVEVPVVVVIPPSVTESTAELAHPIQFGHGFFGDRGEISRGPAKEFAQSYPSVVFGVDWWGMSGPDRDVVLADLISNPSNTLRFTERVHQGMANQLALSRAIQTTLRDVPELQNTGAAHWRDEPPTFWGISQGHILGGTYVALGADIEKAVLEVGGAAFTFIMFRAGPFAPFLIFIQQVLANPLDQQKFAALSQTSFDRIDPVAYAHLVQRAPLAGGVSDRQIFMAAGLGDPAVPNLATYLHARSIGLSVLDGSAYVPFGFESVALPAPGGLVLHDFGVEEPLPGTFADGQVRQNDVHEGVRTSPAHQAQIDAFIATGSITSECDGTCDPD